jgi:hypothetical protein
LPSVIGATELAMPIRSSREAGLLTEVAALHDPMRYISSAVPGDVGLKVGNVYTPGELLVMPNVLNAPVLDSRPAAGLAFSNTFKTVCIWMAHERGPY